MENQLSLSTIQLDNIENYISAKEINQRHKISIAPMLNITDNYFRSFLRLLTQNSVLYTEMIHTETIKNSLRGYMNELAFEENQHPIVVQLGGNCPEGLGSVAKLCKEIGYDEINLNCGCPSSKVQEHKFGAMLMENPDLVSECVKNIRKNSNLETTVKCRLGLNTFKQEFLDDFIDIVSKKGNVNHFIIHSRIAIMSLDTEKNRKIPPLQYEMVFSLKKKFPWLNFSLNGGIKTLDHAHKILEDKNQFLENDKYFDCENGFNINIEKQSIQIEKVNDLNLVGCMIGRTAYENPWILSNVDKKFYGKKNLGFSKKEVVLKYADFIDKKAQQLNNKIDDLNYNYLRMVKPLTFLFPGERGTNQFKRNLVDFKRNDANFSIYDHILKTFEIFEKRNPNAVEIYPLEDD